MDKLLDAKTRDSISIGKFCSLTDAERQEISSLTHSSASAVQHFFPQSDCLLALTASPSNTSRIVYNLAC